MHLDFFSALKFFSQLKMFNVFLIFARNIVCGYPLEAPRHNLCFGLKDRVYAPSRPSFSL